nr:tape measure protein [Haloferula luteola]
MGAAAAAAVSLAKAGQLARDSFLAFAQEERLQKGLAAIMGDGEAAAARMRELQLVAKMPGLGFQEAVQGDIRLQAVGFSAARSTQLLLGFGNALATVGGGKAELDGVIVALSQMAAKGKISAEEINQIAERVPQIRTAIKNAFGNADSEFLQAAGVSVEEFIDGITKELAKLPRAAGGAANSIENLEDAWTRLKSGAGAQVAKVITPALNSAADAAENLAAALDRTPLEEKKAQAEALAASQQKAAAAAEEERDSLQAAAAHAERLHRAALYEAEARERVEAAAQRQLAAKRALDAQLSTSVKQTQEVIFSATLDQPANIQRQIQNLLRSARLSIPFGNSVVTQADIRDARSLNEVIGRIGDKLSTGSKIALSDKLRQLVELEKQLADLNKAAADEAAREAEERDRTAASRSRAAVEFAREGALLRARIGGNAALVEQLERQRRVEELKARLMEDQGLSAADALRLAQERIALEDQAAKSEDGGRKRIRLKSAEESAASRFSRLSKADREKVGGTMSGYLSRNQADRLNLAQRAMAAAKSATGKDANSRLPTTSKLEGLTQKTHQELAAINARLQDLGLAS